MTIFTIHFQPTLLHIIIPPWQLTVSMHQIGSLLYNQHDKLMVKMTILFLLYSISIVAMQPRYSFLGRCVGSKNHETSSEMLIVGFLQKKINKMKKHFFTTLVMDLASIIVSINGDLLKLCTNIIWKNQFIHCLL